MISEVNANSEDAVMYLHLTHVIPMSKVIIHFNESHFALIC